MRKFFCSQDLNILSLYLVFFKIYPKCFDLPSS